MAGPSNRPYDLTEPIYSVIDFESLAAEDDILDAEERVRSPTTSTIGSRPASKGRGDRQQVRQQKRREQNKAAQRSFRARKEQHLSEILSQIESLELRKRTIEEENQLLMHELLRKRAENNLLRSGGGRISQTSDPRNPGGGLTTLTRHISLPQETGAAGKRPQRDFPGAAEQREKRSRTLPIESLMWLYGPFVDVWNLIKEQPAVMRGDVDPDDVMERLKEMARYEESAAGNRRGDDDDGGGSGGGGSGSSNSMGMSGDDDSETSSRTVRQQRARSL